MPRSNKLEKQVLNSLQQEFVFVQVSNLATWNINHNLNKFYPSVWVEDEFGETIIGNVKPIDKNNLQIIFTIPSKGTAYLH